MSVVKRILYVVCQWTWGIVQNVAGLLFFVVMVWNRHSIFRGAVVTHWNHPYSMGCGMFIFLGDHGFSYYSRGKNEKINHDVLVHEYGHTVQSIILGPLFVPVIAIPSLLWASLPYFERLRRKKSCLTIGFIVRNGLMCWETKFAVIFVKSVNFAEK